MPYPLSTGPESYSLQLLEYAQHSAKNYHIIDGIRDIRLRQGVYEFEVKWLGFEDTENTWESLQQLKEDAAGEVEDFLHSPGKRNLKRTVLSLYY